MQKKMYFVFVSGAVRLREWEQEAEPEKNIERKATWLTFKASATATAEICNCNFNVGYI